MNLRVDRFSDNGESTLGLLFIDGEFECYTLEDEARTEKVFGETRVPEGTYLIQLRTVGGHHARYSKNYPDIHKGMLHVTDVNGFSYILIHIGNKDDDTAGCLLVGDSPNNNKITDGFLGNSGNAYLRMYKKVLAALESGEEVKITYQDIES